MFAKKEVSRNSLNPATEVLNGFNNIFLTLLAINVESARMKSNSVYFHAPCAHTFGARKMLY